MGQLDSCIEAKKRRTHTVEVQSSLEHEVCIYVYWDLNKGLSKLLIYIHFLADCRAARDITGPICCASRF